MTAIIGPISQEGGIGKSTLARAVAREAVANGLKVKLADLDTQQGTSSNWHHKRLEAGAEPVFSVEAFKTATQALKVTPEYDVLVLDGPARASTATLEIARQASVVVQPTGASADDLHPAVLTFHELVREGVPPCPARLRCAQDWHRCRRNRGLCLYIAQAGFHALMGFVLERPAYCQAQNRSFTITETRYPQLNRRADELLQAIVERIN